jgi:GH25 family lysozyme M1 (1,4-beta-N-acetylmuramidase)
MKLTDRRLYQAANLEDFVFRFYFREEDSPTRRIAKREVEGLIAAGFVAPDIEQIFGVDTSDWDGNVNFQVFKDYGGKFAYIKCIDGTVPSKYWAANNQRAIEAGLLNTVYGWLYPDNRVSCVLQARAYHNLIKGARLSLPPVIDFEWTKYAGIQANPTYTDLDKWVTEFIHVSGVKPLLYSAAGYMNLFGAMPIGLRAKFAGFIWASYGGLQPIYPKGFGAPYNVWQFSANGDALTLCPGDRNKKELDLNYMNADFYARYKSEVPTQPPTEPEGDSMATNKVTVTWDDGARERREPRVQSGIDTFRSILLDNSVHYSDFDVVPDANEPMNPDKKWIKLQSGWYIATRYPSSSGVVQRAIVESVTPPPVDPDPAEGYEVETLEFVLTDKLTGKRYRGTIGGLTLIEETA